MGRRLSRQDEEEAHEKEDEGRQAGPSSQGGMHNSLEGRGDVSEAEARQWKGDHGVRSEELMASTGVTRRAEGHQPHVVHGHVLWNGHGELKAVAASSQLPAMIEADAQPVDHADIHGIL